MSGHGKYPGRPEKDQAHPTYVTTTLLGSGYAAVLLWWNPEHGGFYEPWTTGIGRYATEAEAAQEAKEWAQDEEIEFKVIKPEEES